MGANLEGTKMIYFAMALAVLGALAGMAFRWKVLLPLIVLLPIAVLILQASGGSSLEDGVIIVVLAEAILQGGYFVGLLIRSIASAGMRSVRASRFSRSRPAHSTRDSDARPISPAEPRNGH